MKTIYEPRSNKYFILRDRIKSADASSDYTFKDHLEKEFFEERAAIVEYEGHLSRNEAEMIAYQRVLERRQLYAQAS